MATITNTINVVTEEPQKWVKPEVKVLSINNGTLGAGATATDTTPTSNPAS